MDNDRDALVRMIAEYEDFARKAPDPQAAASWCLAAATLRAAIYEPPPLIAAQAAEPVMTIHPTYELLTEVRREIRMRASVYRRQVDAGAMTAAEREKRIGMMQDIASILEDRLRTEGSTLI